MGVASSAKKMILVLVLSLFFLGTVRGESVISALKKSQHNYNASAKVVDIVDVVEGYHPDAISLAVFNNSINDTG